MFLSVVFGVLEGGVCFGDRDFQTASSLTLASPMRGSQSKGRAARLTGQTGFARIRKLSPLCTTSLSAAAPGLPVPGGLGGRSRIEFIMSPLSRRRHNESHFAAQSPERSFFFPLFLSPRKKKRLLATQSQNLCHQSKIRQTTS